MSERNPSEEAVLGRTLAETAALNAPERRASVAAADVVSRVTRGPSDHRIRRRRFVRSLLWLALALALFAGLALALEAFGL